MRLCDHDVSPPVSYLLRAQFHHFSPLLARLTDLQSAQHMTDDLANCLYPDDSISSTSWKERGSQNWWESKLSSQWG